MINIIIYYDNYTGTHVQNKSNYNVATSYIGIQECKF